MDKMKINDLKLEQYRLGELQEEEMLLINKQIKLYPELQNRLKKIEEEETIFHKEISSEEMIGDILNKHQSKKIKSKRKLSFSLVLVPVMIITVMVSITIFTQFNKEPVHKTTQDKDILRVKGDGRKLKEDPKIFLFKKTDTKKVENIKNNSLAQEGDLFQIAYTAGNKKYGIILSLDGKETFTLHYPETEDKNCQLKHGQLVYLEHSYELDNAPDFEQFWFISSNTKIDIAGIIKMIKKGKIKNLMDTSAKFSLPDHFSQHSILVKKRGRQ